MSEQPSSHKIDASKVTKPIQLLAAWLIGMILTNGSFLAAAATIQRPDWAASVLVIATIVNVPLFLFCLFLLQTKFRPEMQEDSYYATYLERRYSTETQKTEYIEVVGEKHRVRARKSRVIEATEPPELIIESPRQHFTVQINDLLPQYAEMSEELKKAGIGSMRTFGSTSSGPEVPVPFILSVGLEAPIDILKQIFPICMKYKLEGIARAASPIGDDSIYIGSYAYRNESHRFRSVDQNVRKLLLAKDLTRESLNKLLDNTGIPGKTSPGS